MADLKVEYAGAHGASGVIQEDRRYAEKLYQQFAAHGFAGFTEVRTLSHADGSITRRGIQ